MKKPTLIMLFALLVAFYATNVTRANHEQSYQAVRGLMDLSEINFTKVASVDLNGQWSFYWKQLLTPQDIENGRGSLTYYPVPQVWTKHRTADHRELTSSGYATYRLTIQLNPRETGKVMALYMPGIATAYKLWIDGRLSAETGTVGKSRADMAPKTLPKVVYFKPSGSSITLVLQVSNFVQRKAGIWGKIKLGSTDSINVMREKNIAVELLAAGGLLMMGIYHLSFYFQRKSDKMPLYYGMVCLLITLRTLLLGEMLWVRAFPSFSWAVSVKMEYLTASIGLPLFVNYFYCLYPKECSRKFRNFNLLVGTLFSAVIVATPASIFTYIMQAQQAMIVISFLYVIYVILKAYYHRRFGAALNLLGVVVVFISILNDILYYNQVIFSRNLLPVGLIFFLIIQAYIMSVKISRSYAKIERISNKLHKLNSELDDIVKERTRKLEDSREELLEVNKKLHKLSYYDALTDIYNRRSFEQQLQEELDRASDRPVSLMLIDIDYFKEYNDTYGHQEGDHCIKKVAETLQAVLEAGGGMVARWGGEEFIALLPNTSAGEAKEIAERLRTAVLALGILHAKSSASDYVTVSIGLSALDRAGSAEQRNRFIQEADEALYQAKRHGRNKVSAFGGM